MPDFLISEEQRQSLLEYLTTKPYREVVLGVQMLAQLKRAEPNKDETKEK